MGFDLHAYSDINDGMMRKMSVIIVLIFMHSILTLTFQHI